MSNEPRKATDILLELESKIDMVLLLIKNQDLNIKLISNKLNDIVNEITLLKSDNKSTSEKISIESIDHVNSLEEKKDIIINSEFNLQVDSSPKGFRRTSRPETFSGDDSYLDYDNNIKFPVQLPNNEVVKDITINDGIKEHETTFKNYEEPSTNTQPLNNVSIIQRVVDKNGKSVFLADVEVLNSSNDSIIKTRTNGTGKWMASIPPGDYRIIIRKRESLTKERMEVLQNINIDSEQSSKELSTVIIK